MSNYTQINISAATLQTKVGQIGNLANLDTAHKDNLVGAINEVAEADNEVALVSLVPVAGTIDYTNSNVVVTVEGIAENFPVDANGQTHLLVPKGKQYTVTYPSYLGYSTPAAETYTANLQTRSITKNYAESVDLDDVAASVVLEESSNPAWTQGGKIAAVNQILDADGSWVIDEVHKKRAKLSASDGMKFADGTAWSGTYGNAFRHIVGCYAKQTVRNSDNKTVLHLSTRGIGSKQFPDMWIGTYKGNVHDGKLWSQPNRQATGNRTITQFFADAQAQSQSYGLVNYHEQCYLVALHLVKFGTPDVLGNMGIGLQDAGSAYYNAMTGYTAALGDGTGEMTYGETQYKQNRLFGIEGLTGQQWEFRPNIFANGGTFIIYKGNQCRSDITTEHEDYMRSVPQISGSDSYIKTMQLGDDFDILPKTTGSTSANDWCDGFYANTSAGAKVVLFGGVSSTGSISGLGSSDSVRDWSDSYAVFGSRLAFRGDISEYEIVSGSALAALNS